jgi:hypothetical protein
MSLLEAAQKFGGTQLKRIVITGSTSSVSNYFQAGDEAHNAWTEADWNQVGNIELLESVRMLIEQSGYRQVCHR